MIAFSYGGVFRVRIMSDLAGQHADKTSGIGAVRPSDSASELMVVGIGASAGGLEPCRALVAAIPADGAMACIVVQHLDPSHESMMVGLLAARTAMTVVLAQDGMPVERGHVYVIPPGAYLSMREGRLRLSKLDGHHGVRLPFDHLLRSMALDCGRRAVCVVLSGGGADGSVGLAAVKAEGGFVVVQDPDEATHDGMPRNAIATGGADVVLRVAAIAAAVAGYGRQIELSPEDAPNSGHTVHGRLGEVIDLLRTTTAHDFSLYKPGTLNRRLDRRMAVAGIGAGELDRYLDVLREDPHEVDALAKDLLIHVTGFFRDADVFDRVASEVIPSLVRDLPPGRPLRVWVPGCSTGEEAYSLAMIFHDEIEFAGSGAKLQIFASDVDADSIAAARSGLYPDVAVAGVAPGRLMRFFLKEGDAYRVSNDLRACVVFTVQDVLLDPPFSRIDMVSCRNLLIYLGAEAKRKVVSLFHYALREGGILLLGNTETVGKPDGRFEVLGDKERLFLRMGRKHKADPAFPSRDAVRGSRISAVSDPGPVKATLADLCRDLLMEAYAPAAVLVDRRNAYLFLFGRIDDYLQAAPGNAGHDVLAMARDGVRAKLRSAIQRARSEGARIVVTGGRMKRDDVGRSFDIAVQPVPDGGDGMLLICFLETADERKAPRRSCGTTLTAELEMELDSLRAELDGALRSHELFDEEQKAANEEALSVNEEYQSTNEELISSKEELQSLNEELSALNNQLQETLEQQRTTSNDLQNVLFSTDVATLFLDLDLSIRFFTPTVRRLFSVIPSDVGRPLADFASLIQDVALLDDARAVLISGVSVEREIGASQGAWFSRRILPYRTQGSKVEGVVITYADVTDRRLAARALEAAKGEAERADAAKSRFLAAASHDLRQPLQALKLLLGMLRKVGDMDQAMGIVERSEESLAVMAGMLNTLLDINRIEAGAVTAEVVDFPVDRLLEALRLEFTAQAEAQRLELRIVPSGLTVETDPRLLEQMLRNLLANALKYTRRGRILVGCRRRDAVVALEVWDTGIGIPETDLKAIFEEYHQVGNAARDKGKGLGLGLAIVQRLADLLGHHVHVRSHQGRGSVFSIDIARSAEDPSPKSGDGPVVEVVEPVPDRAAVILIVEDDADVRDLLRMFIDGEGHTVIAVADGAKALDLVDRSRILPDLILADYNLPGGMNGLEVATRLRTKLHLPIPVVVLTGDISREAASDLASGDCVVLTKPVEARKLSRTIQDLLAASSPSAPTLAARAAIRTDEAPVIFLVDDDDAVRAAIRCVLEGEGCMVEDFPTCEGFLSSYDPDRRGCLLIDAHLKGMDGFGLLGRMADLGYALPAIMITGDGDVAMAVRAMKAGACDFIEKPVGREDLLSAIAKALQQGRDVGRRRALRQEAVDHLAGLTPRQREIMALVLSGHPSKNIAADLGISQRTVENHRAMIMQRTGSRSLPALARLSFLAHDAAGDHV
jgi:two-component system CheB/CheR fusion protein